MMVSEGLLGESLISVLLENFSFMFLVKMNP